MRQLDALALSYEVEGVLADDVAASKGHHTHLVGGPRSDLAASAMTHRPFRVELLRLGHHLPEMHRGAARRVDLVPVVDLDDLGIERWT
jgi:hypothetical protein